MEAYRKTNRGSMKGKLVPFHRASKPSSTMQYAATDIRPNQKSSPPASVGFVVHQQDYATTKRNPIRIVVADSRSNLDELYGHGDESVDIKAEIYITTQKRFMLERLNAEANTFKDK